MIYFKQSLFSLLSSAAAMTIFLVLAQALNIFINSGQQFTFEVILNAVVIVIALTANILSGYFFLKNYRKAGFIIEFLILLIIAVFTIIYENTIIYYIGMFLNPVYIYCKNIVWLFNPILSDNLLLKGAFSVISALLPSLCMFIGTKTAEKRKN